MEVIKETINISDLRDGMHFARVTHFLDLRQKTKIQFYTTQVTNLTDQHIQVVKFAEYKRISRDIYQQNTVNDRYYTTEEFNNWYGLGDVAWLAPGVSVFNPNNHCHPGTLWVYFCRTEQNEEFIVGAIAQQPNVVASWFHITREDITEGLAVLGILLFPIAILLGAIEISDSVEKYPVILQYLALGVMIIFIIAATIYTAIAPYLHLFEFFNWLNKRKKK